MNEFDPQAMQEKYEHWCELHQQLIEAQEKFVESIQLMKELQVYYQSEQWRHDNQNRPSLKCAKGVYSILSEDGLWNSLSEHQEQAIRWMKLGLEVIDR